MGIAWSGNATTLFMFAKDAVQQIAKNKPSERQPGQPPTIVAIVFSAIALEGFINELADIAAFPVPPGNPPYHPSVPMVAAILREVEDSYSSVRAKFLLARWVFSGEPYDKGALPYQDFNLLIELRNTLVHIKGLDITTMTPTGEKESNEPRIIQKLLPKKILADPTLTGLWIERITTLETARWACNTATAMFQSLVDDIPDADFKRRLVFGYGNHFSQV